MGAASSHQDLARALMSSPQRRYKLSRITFSAQYEAGSAPALALQATKERTQKRFANYAGAGLLCGTDGLPHLISDPGLALRYGHAGEVFVSTLSRMP